MIDEFLLEYFELLDKYNTALVLDDHGEIAVQEVSDDQVNEIVDDLSEQYGIVFFGGYDED